LADLDTAVRHAAPLVPQDRRAAVAGLTGGRTCRDVLRCGDYPLVIVIALTWDEDGDAF